MLILRGFRAQFTLLAVHNALCGLVGLAVVSSRAEDPSDARRLRPSQIARYCLPLAVCHAAKLYAQNKALECMTPAFLSMVFGATPVLVAISCVLLGWEPFRWTNLALFALASAGVALTALGESARDDDDRGGGGGGGGGSFGLSDDFDPAGGYEYIGDGPREDASSVTLGAALAVVGVVAETARLLLLQHLLKRLGVRVGLVLVYTAPLEIALLSLGAIVFEFAHLPAQVARFDATLWTLLLIDTAWAVCTNVTAFLFVRAGSALLAACAAPFKDVATVVLSDTLVEPRGESRITVFGYSLACVASFAYAVNALAEKDEETSRTERGDEFWDDDGFTSKDGFAATRRVRRARATTSEARGTLAPREREPLLVRGERGAASPGGSPERSRSFEGRSKAHAEERRAARRVRARLVAAAVVFAAAVNAYFFLRPASESAATDGVPMGFVPATDEGPARGFIVREAVEGDAHG
jgi:drug/metabolite transporter (DMT)-like permease